MAQARSRGWETFSARCVMSHKLTVSSLLPEFRSL
jgi:hypothetical protein